jgi:hypothetical protein
MKPTKQRPAKRKSRSIQSAGIRPSDRTSLLVVESSATHALQLGSHAIVPQDEDILSGRGGFVNNHPGNMHYVALVRGYRESYASAPRSQKQEISQYIVRTLREENRRFLRWRADSNLWVLMTQAEAVRKTSGAIRDDLRHDRNGRGILMHHPSETHAPPMAVNVPLVDVAFVEESALVHAKGQLPDPPIGFQWHLQLTPIVASKPEPATTSDSRLTKPTRHLLLEINPLSAQEPEGMSDSCFESTRRVPPPKGEARSAKNEN